MNSVHQHSVASSFLFYRLFSLTAVLAATLLALLIITFDTVRAFDDSLYPNLKGQWLWARPPAGVRGQGPFDPDKSWGLAQQAPLTPEYQAIFEASATGHSHPRFCVVTFKSAGVPERSASNERRSAGISCSGVVTLSPIPPQDSATFSKSGAGLRSTSGIVLALVAWPSG